MRAQKSNSSGHKGFNVKRIWIKNGDASLRWRVVLKWVPGFECQTGVRGGEVFEGLKKFTKGR